MKSKKTVGQRVKIMRIPINWKSPPQKGHREPTPWGIPGLLCEKRIPKHGDENRRISSPASIQSTRVKKESPNMGTKTSKISRASMVL